MKLVQKLIVILVACVNFMQVSAIQGHELEVNQLVTFMALGTGSPTGTYYPLGSALANAWTTRLNDIDVMAHSTKGSVENLNLLRNGELNLAIAQGDIVVSAIEGTKNFNGNAYVDLRIIMSLFPEVLQIVVTEQSGISSIDDLKGQEIIVGAPGSGNALTSIELLKVLGLQSGDYTPIYLSYDESIQAIERDEQIAAIIIAGIPTRVITEMRQRTKIRVLSLKAEQVKLLVEQLPYFAPLKISSHIYADDHDLETVALMAMLVADKSLSPENVYSMTKILFESLDYLGRIHERAKDISMESFMYAIPKGFLHTGSQKFYDDARDKFP